MMNTAFADVSGLITVDDIALGNAGVYLFDETQNYTETSSDSDGYFEFSNLEDRWYRILVVSPVNSNGIPSFYPNELEYCEGNRFWGGDNHQLAVPLDLGNVIEANLQSETSPLRNALLTAKPSEGLLRGGWSDDSGSVWIGGIPSGTITVGLEGEHTPDQWIANDSWTYDSTEASSIELNSDIDLGEQTVLKGIQVSGLVHYGSQPIPNAIITVYSNSQLRNTTTNDEGIYSVDGLPSGDVLAWMSVDGYANTYSPNDDRPTSFFPITEEGEQYEFLDISAPLESQILITLLDAQTEDPIQGASILLYNDNRTVGRGEPVDSNGVATIKGLHSGQYQAYIYAENDGYYNGFVEDVLGEPLWIEVTQEDTTEMDVFWESKHSALFKVVDDEDNPVPGVLILSTLQSEPTTFERDYSNRNGDSVIFGLDTGVWEITVSFSPLCPSDVGYLAPEPFTLQIPQQDITEIVLLIDDDQDGMPSKWEEEWGLNPYENDANEDPDGDGLTNQQEYLAGSNPLDRTPQKECGCQDSSTALLWFSPIIWVWRRRG